MTQLMLEEAVTDETKNDLGREPAQVGAASSSLGDWPLECWIFDCAFPRVDGLHCEQHAWRELPRAGRRWS